MLAVLTRARCPLDAVNIDGVTALAIAAIDGNGRAVKKLLALGANPTVRGALGHSALGLCIVQPRCASEVGVHNSEGSTTEKDPEQPHPGARGRAHVSDARRRSFFFLATVTIVS